MNEPTPAILDAEHLPETLKRLDDLISRTENVERLRSGLGMRLALSMALYGVSYLAVAVTPWFPAVLVLVFAAHLAGGANWTLSNYALQGEVPDRLRGRVFATDLMLATMAIAVSQLGATAVVDVVDERWILAGCGLITLLYAIGWRIATRRVGRPSAVGS